MADRGRVATHYLVNPRKRARRTVSRRVQRRVSRKIGQLVREGVPDGHGQAGAIAYSEQRRRKRPRRGSMARRRRRRRHSRKRRSAAQVRAFKKMIAALHAKRGGKKRRRRRRHAAVNSRRRRRHHRKEAVVARRRRKHRRRRRSVALMRINPRRRHHRRNPRRRHRRHYRRNPGFKLPSVRGVLGKLQRGVMDAVKIEGGKVGARFLGNLAPAGLKDTLPKNLAVQVAAALVVGLAADQFLGGETARFILAGGLTAPLEAALKPVPVIGPLLGDDYLSLGGGVGSYLPGVGEGWEPDDTRSEGNPSGMGAYDVEGVG